MKTIVFDLVLDEKFAAVHLLKLRKLVSIKINQIVLLGAQVYYLFALLKEQGESVDVDVVDEA